MDNQQEPKKQQTPTQNNNQTHSQQNTTQAQQQGQPVQASTNQQAHNNQQPQQQLPSNSNNNAGQAQAGGDAQAQGEQGEWESFGSQQNQNSDGNQQQSGHQQSSQLQSALQQALNQLQQNIQAQQQAAQQGQEQQEQDQQSLPIPLPPPQQQQTLGCQHYLRNCQVQAPCCKLYYVCKLCHDQKYQGPKSKGCKIQRMAFDQVKHIKCLQCHTEQQPSLKCINPQCEITFGKYACLKCKLYENRSTKVNDIFHCDQCKMCRRGKKQNFFHCKMCGYCRAISEKGKHKCTENAAESSCPICLQVLKYSTKHYFALPCGHLIHVQCASSYTSINCPVCGMAMQKLSENRNKQIQQMIEQTKANMPKELADKKVNILCNQCLHKSVDVQFHFFGMKCEKCGTFNTKMI